MPTRSSSLNLLKGLGRKNSSDVAEVDDSEENDISQEEWSQYSIAELAQ